jgi:hypothetical protein
MSVQNLSSAQDLALSILFHQVKVLAFAHYHPLDLEILLILLPDWLSCMVCFVLQRVDNCRLIKAQLLSKFKLDFLHVSAGFIIS